MAQSLPNTSGKTSPCCPRTTAAGAAGPSPPARTSPSAKGPGDDPTITAAAAGAGADSVLATLPDGLDTSLAPSWWGGRDLSGGQWQRIAAARIVVLDGGEIVEEGTHETLLDHSTGSGAYAAMCRTQANTYASTPA
ncbi:MULTISPECIES: hypothetical protein [Streptomyces]|uniref:ATP-binding cassette, subfamily B n=1 Tax=Streptomyces lonegramiae TaxID=3075524 RepID=A0ABU2X5K4_9ACTN|nr:hypothetical protein [Streptomyces sp. DSM 41529]MDT0541188.1 hypothetical protein [Streptomyces sp. DSM 41529]